MKTFSYILFMLLLLAITGLFFLKQPNGKPWLSINKVEQIASSKWAEIQLYVEKQFDNGTTIIQRVTTDGQSEIYRWQDEEGMWHYTDNAQDIVNAEKVIYDNNAIATFPKVEFTTNTINSNKDAKTTIESDKFNPLTISPTQLESLITDANKVQTVIDNRNLKLKQIK